MIAPTPAAPTITAVTLRRRFWRTSMFLARTLVAIWLWEFVIPYRLRLGFLNRDPEERRRQWARDYRAFAISLGGVWIKLGQFFSSRADILPPDLTGILADLQDEVSPVAYADIERQIVRELKGEPTQFFATFDKVPRASASLGQVHFATLPSGRPVAVKVQRPGIRAIIEVDLRALRGAIEVLKGISFIRRRANLNALYDEFSSALFLELDYVAEGRSAEQFAENFTNDRQVSLPTPHWPLTTMRVLTLERVNGIKINNYVELEAAGISRAQVAQKVFKVYLKQVFEDGFFHADPHPGNLYIRPKGEKPTDGTPRDFELIFLDFGMVGHISEKTRALLRRMVIATVQRDYPELVRLAKELGFLLPDADNKALVIAIETLFERFYGLNMAELTKIDYNEIEQLTKQFRNLLFDFPFQLPQDFIFLGRTLSMLAGLATGLDPNFSPVAGLEPFARRLIGAEAGNLVNEYAREASELVGLLLALPRRMDRLLRRVEDGDLAAESLQPMVDGMSGIEGAINRLTDTMLMMAFSVGWYFLKEEKGPLRHAAPGALAAMLYAVWRLIRGGKK
jgi:predicted unusual protein kinase regulating ubiquinone biosynthesis (AarF/ABC1/UbiB family)